ncbi:hypothetical protein Avbf_07516 [Armadillidium vulgare]|nr:hypothetical protein Avbf_07516 [Armadillidium vulgare]
MSTSILPRQKKFARKLYDGLLFSTVVVVLLLSFTGVIFPHNTYIQCNDPYISHGYYKDTISVATLISISIIVPFIVMVIVEWINFLNRPIPSPFKRSFKRSYSLFSWYFIGNLFSLCIVEILKSAVSEPRPNFMSTCSPNLTEEVYGFTLLTKIVLIL